MTIVMPAFAVIASCFLAQPSTAQTNAAETVERQTNLDLPPYIASRRIKFGSAYKDSFSIAPAKLTNIKGTVVVLGGSRWSSPADGTYFSWLTFRLVDAGYAVVFPEYGAPNMTAASTLEQIVRGLVGVREALAHAGAPSDDLVLLGVNGGAHYATLLGTDERLLKDAGVPFPTLKGVVSINGTGFDIPKRVQSSSKYLAARYRRSFGIDANAQAQLSPVNFVSESNAPAFLFFVVDGEKSAKADTDEMLVALRRSSSKVEEVSLPKLRDNAESAFFLREPDGPGRELMKFLGTNLGPRK